LNSSKKTLPQMPIDHPISSRPAFVSHLIMREEKAQNAKTRRKHSLFPKDAVRLLLIGRQYRAEKEKIYRGIIGGKSRIAPSLAH
jgi:hypothetical protein